ncbi:MAG: hypothetical protein AAB552_00175 [Patescibacteria group bacterium]
MNKNIQLPKVAKVSAWMLAGVFIGAPFLASSAGLIPCGDKGEASCGFEDLIKLANTVVNFLIYSVVIPLTALAFMVIGGRFVIVPDKESVRSDTKNQLQQIGIGIFWILAAFVLVKAFLFAFLNTDAGFTSFLLQ